MAKVLPLGDRVVINKDMPTSKILVIPDTALDAARITTTTGMVVAIGPDVLHVAVGDYVTFGQYAGKRLKVKDKETGELLEYDIMREEDVLAVLV